MDSQLLRSGVEISVSYNEMPIPEGAEDIMPSGTDMTATFSRCLSWRQLKNDVCVPHLTGGALRVSPMRDNDGPAVVFMISMDHHDGRVGSTICLPLDVAEEVGKRIAAIAKMAKL